MNLPPSLRDESPEELLRLIDVTVQRDASTLLDHVNLVIPRHRHTAILGPNGSGKTSLMRLLTRQYYPSVLPDGSQGRVLILGRDDWNVSEYRRRIGIISSATDRAFTSGRSGRMTAAQIVASGFTATELATFGSPLDAKQNTQVQAAVRAVDAESLVDRRGETMSTGELRRVLIARAIVHEPDVLVLDEPTTGLDLAARHRFLQTLQSLMDQRPLTLVLVTHHVEEILPAINSLVTLDRGRVVFDGEKADGLTNAWLTRLFGVAVTIRPTENGYHKVDIDAS